MELLQLAQEVLAINAFAASDLSTSDELIDHPHRSIGNSATPVARIDLPLLPQFRDAARVGMALDQVEPALGSGRRVRQ